MKWDAKSIIVHNWPKLYKNSEGHWERTWEIVLQEPVSELSSVRTLESDLKNHEKWISVKVSGDTLHVTVTTVRWGWDDDLYGYSYEILKSINDSIGEIKIIQGQKRDLWPPWLYKKEQSS